MTVERLSMRYPDVVREAFYVGSASSSLFTWQHASKAPQWRNEVVIVCGPMGYEYTHAHRSLKHLADSFAQQGFVALRFDYHGMGDSPGNELDAGLVAIWQKNIESLIAFAQKKYPGSKICLAGLRFGATLASLVASRVAVDHLLLWEPIVKAKAYVREMTALARFSSAPNEAKDYIESAGFLMAKATADDIKEINLLSLPACVNESVLIATRDDRPVDDVLLQKFIADGVNTTQVSLPGFANMMAEPQQTQVPLMAIDNIIRWLVDSNPSPTDQLDIDLEAARSVLLKEGDELLEERPRWYDLAQQLFSVSSYPQGERDKSLPAVILINSGSVHHVGPHRLYCQVARVFAGLGYYVLRLDLEGLGDSCKVEIERENHPYQTNAVANIYQAMDFLTREGIATQFILGGVCSGAHTAFHCALTAVKENRRDLIKEILLINPLTFYWEEGMSLAIPSETQNLHDTAYYRQSIRNPDKWKKLLTGKASTGYILRYACERIKNLVHEQIKYSGELLFNQQSQLSADFKRIREQGIAIRFVLSSTDPGHDIIKSQARRALNTGLTNKTITLTLVDGADHTFSRKEKRDHLLTLIRAEYSRIH